MPFYTVLVWFKVSVYPVLIRFFALARGGVTPPRPRLATGMLRTYKLTTNLISKSLANFLASILTFTLFLEIELLVRVMNTTMRD